MQKMFLKLEKSYIKKKKKNKKKEKSNVVLDYKRERERRRRRSWPNFKILAHNLTQDLRDYEFMNQVST